MHEFRTNDKLLAILLRQITAIYNPLKAVLSRVTFAVIMKYSRFMSLLRLLPGLGVFLEKVEFCVMGDMPKLPIESAWC
jgi:hypothetical protein